MFPVRRQISPHAPRLRRDATDVEKRLWSALRNRQLGGFKFRRQWTINRYIVDFACLEAMLVIELDGGQHSPERDALRTAHLEAKGFHVLRFWNQEMIDNPGGVLETILSMLIKRTASERQKTLTQPSPAKAGEG